MNLKILTKEQFVFALYMDIDQGALAEHCLRNDSGTLIDERYQYHVFIHPKITHG